MTTLKTLTIAGVLLTTLAIQAQVPDHPLRADIPFSFSVENQLMPAGVYDLISLGAGRIAIRNSQENRTVVLLTMPVRTLNAPESSHLIFKRYGEAYVLTRIWTSGEAEGRELFVRKVTRQLARQSAPSEAVVAAKTSR